MRLPSDCKQGLKRQNPGAEWTHGSMVQEHLVACVRGCLAARREERSRVHTRAQVWSLRDEVRRKLRRCFGPFPQRTPLNARVTGTIEREAYIVEKVLFESRPCFQVTGNLYIPRRAKAPLPSVLATCGHTDLGKAETAYQAFVRNLARQGYLTFIYDPIAQGERRQYSVADGMKRRWGCVTEHLVTGGQMRLTGDFFGMWCLWDGLRALDYLLSRPEADHSRVGVTGNSGGGTLASYLTAFDERLTMAAPSCFITSYGNNAENELPADSEQMPPGMLAEGLDMADFFVAHLPRPTLLLGQNNDEFDRRGLEEAYRELRRLYALAGAEENIQLFVGPTDHGYSVHNREAMYRFFNRHAGVRARAREDASEIPEKPGTLWAAPGGSTVRTGSRRVSDFTRARARQLAGERTDLPAETLQWRIVQRLQLTRRHGPPHYRRLRHRMLSSRPPCSQSRFGVETEPGIQALLSIFSPKTCFHLPALRNATVYVPHLSARGERDSGLAPQAKMFFAVEVRGIGELTAASCGASEFLNPVDADYFYAAHGDMLNMSYAGRRVHDLLCVLDLLEDNGCRKVHLIGRGMGAVTAAYAACLHTVVRQVTLHNALLSYHELTQVAVPRWPLSALVPGALQDFDLPDCYRRLRSKALTLVSPWTGRMRPWKNWRELRHHLQSLGLATVPLKRE